MYPPPEQAYYSTSDEVLTGETWIDGKPIYQKVFNVTLGDAPVGGSDFTRTIKIIDYNFSGDIVSCNGIFINGNYQESVPWVYFGGKAMYVMAIRGGDNVLQIWTMHNDPNNNGLPVRVVLKYTK